MDAHDATRRILWRNRWLLLAFTLIPVAIAVPVLRLQPVLYSATANVQAQAAVPDSDAQVLGLVGRVSAVASSLDVVQRAISTAGVDRSAVDVARNHLTTTSVGSSGVVAVTVTDSDRAVAVALTRDLASAVVNSLNALGSDSSSQLAVLTDQQTSLTASRTSLLDQLAQAQAAHQQVTDPGVQALITELSAVETQLSNNVSATQQLLATTGAKADAGVVNSPSFATAVRPPVASYAALAALLGLVVALLMVTVRELVRPTVAEPGAGARELGLVLLGEAQMSTAGEADPDDDLPARIEIAAHRIGAGTLVLTGPLPRAQLTALADSLGAALRPADGGPPLASTRAPAISAVQGSHPAPSQIPRLGRAGGAASVTVLSEAALTLHTQDQSLILVLPAFAPRSALDQAGDLALTTGWPVLGVVGVRRQTRRRRKARKLAADAAKAAEAEQNEELPAVAGANPGGDCASGKEPGSRTLVITASRIPGPAASDKATAAPDTGQAPSAPSAPSALGAPSATNGGKASVAPNGSKAPNAPNGSRAPIAPSSPNGSPGWDVRIDKTGTAP